MLTAILPVSIRTSLFWASRQGLEEIKSFLSECSQIPEIDQYVVVTADESIVEFAKQFKMIVSDQFALSVPKNSYTFSQSLDLAQFYKGYCSSSEDSLLFLDHRNVFLGVNEIRGAISFYERNRGTGIISLGFCRDYPCQYKSFYTFLDCLVFSFDHDLVKDDAQLVTERVARIDGFGKVSIKIISCESDYIISFQGDNKGYVAQIIPFGSNGPIYELYSEFQIMSNACDYKCELGKVKFEGLIVILKLPSLNGVYDTVEFFTPVNGSWELGNDDHLVVDKATKQLLNGRQQFEDIYSYDGSICILGEKQLIQKHAVTPALYVLEKSRIINDMVDYLFAMKNEPGWQEIEVC